jgi:hypothetical protein
MKIYIGPHKNWFGPYQLAELIMFWKDKNDETVFNFGSWLAGEDSSDEEVPFGDPTKKPKESLLYRAMKWVDSKKSRKIKIRIDKYDTWNMDSTLSYIILPMLKQLKATKHGAPFVDDEDVPEELRSTSAPPKENDWDTDGNFFKRWDYVMDQMIWSFEQMNPECDWEAQYHTGVSDYRFVKTDPDSVTSQMVPGPNHTAVFDAEGHKKHSDKIDNGLRLFGKYYRGLWD